MTTTDIAPGVTSAHDLVNNLAMCFVLGGAEQSGGHATIASEVGKGTRVDLYLPRAEEAAESRASHAPEAVPLAEDSEVVLVVEDNPEVREVTLQRVEGLGYVALEADSLVSARQIRQPIVDQDDIFTAFDRITYDKGASILNMFERYVGADTFQRGVREHLAARAWGNATSTEFAAAISRAAGKDLGPAFATFLEQPGTPELTATVSGPATLSTSRSPELASNTSAATLLTFASPELPWMSIASLAGTRTCSSMYSSSCGGLPME